jgi:hypothetical protein
MFHFHTGTHIGYCTHMYTHWILHAHVHTLDTACTGTHIGYCTHMYTHWILHAQVHTLDTATKPQDSTQKEQELDKFTVPYKL